MEIIETLDSKINKLIYDYERLKLENISLKHELETLRNDNDELTRNNQDMFLRIDSTLTLAKARKGE